jgi:hypothetical protein
MDVMQFDAKQNSCLISCNQDTNVKMFRLVKCDEPLSWRHYTLSPEMIDEIITRAAVCQ